jgi:hypothetical protein
VLDPDLRFVVPCPITIGHQSMPVLCACGRRRR